MNTLKYYYWRTVEFIDLNLWDIMGIGLVSAWVCAGLWFILVG